MEAPRRSCHLRGMSRRERPNLPGCAFHLTARIHQREELLTPELRTHVVGIIRDQVRCSDVDLLAYAIMPNHFHLVIRQGVEPLDRTMQPIMRRTALLVHRAHDREGHVFERRYRDHACSDPLYLRNAIVYTHLNPVRAGLTRRADEYGWTSHNAWGHDGPAADGRADPVTLARGLPLFATAAPRSSAELRQDYMAFIAWREALDRERAADGAAGDGAVRCGAAPDVDHGDANWVHHFSIARAWPDEPADGPKLHEGTLKPPDLADIARLVVADCALTLDPALVRSRWGGPAYVEARHSIIRRAAAAGFKGVQIAAYLKVSARAVSAVLSADRRRRLNEAG